MRPVAKLAFVGFAFIVSSSSVKAIVGSYGQEAVLGARLLEGTTPVPVCTAADEETVQSIESGTKRLVLVLMEYKPSEAGPQPLSVTIPGGREQVLGVFPGRAFGREATDSHRRFLLALAAEQSGSGCHHTYLRVGETGSA